MKQIFSILFLAFISSASFAQGAFDKSIAEFSTDLADKLSQKGKKKVVVLYITDINKATTVAGKYIADVISINIVNNAGNFQVFDRENLSGIAEAKKLISEGYIDVDKAKELGRLLSVEAIIVGNYTVLDKTIKLTAKALDANTGFIVAASMKDLLLDNDASALLGIGGTSPNSDRGFNSPLNSNEKINNPETVNKECATKNIGDYCFENRRINQIDVTFYSGAGSGREMTLSPGQTQCFYNVAVANCKYSLVEVHRSSEDGRIVSRQSFANGEILVEKCKSKTFTIK
ncbi:MAG: CsgG/HfaB family protein [Saprospiraceae bacterium]